MFKLLLLCTLAITFPHIDRPTSNAMFKNESAFRMKRSLENLKNFYTVNAIKNVYVPINMHQFVQLVDFQTVINQIYNAQLTLTDLDPDMSSSIYTPIIGATGKYVRTNHLRSQQANALKCLNINSTQINILEFTRERFSLPNIVGLADVINVHDNAMSCNIQGKSLENVQCICKLYDIANNVGFHISDKQPATFYEELLQLYPNRVLNLKIDNNKILLDPDLMSITVCSFLQQGQQHSDVLTVAMKQKFYTHVTSIISAILELLQGQTHNLQKLFLLLLESNSASLTEQKPQSDLCQAIKNLRPQKLQLLTQHHAKFKIRFLIMQCVIQKNRL
jgi:phage tail protein X